MSAIDSSTISLEAADGHRLAAYRACPRTPPQRALVVLQEIFGVNAHIRDVAERLAREGYVTLAPDLFHRTNPGYEGGYEDFSPSLKLAGQYTGEQSEADVRAAAAYLASKGVDAARSHAEGKGESDTAIADGCKDMGPERGDNEKLVGCLQEDRRVDVAVVIE